MAKNINDLINAMPPERQERIAKRVEKLKAEMAVTPSCGCIFCDIGLPAIKLKRQWVHRVGKGGWRTEVCTVKTWTRSLMGKADDF